MTMRPDRRLERAVTSLGLLVAVVAVVPATLVAVSRIRYGSAVPLAGVRPPWRWDADEIRRIAAEPLADSSIADLLIRTSLCVIWVAIGVVVLTTIAEVAHMVRHGGIGLPSIRGLGWAQPLARLVATGLLVVAPVHAPKVSLATTGGSGSEFLVREAAPAHVSDGSAGASTTASEERDAPADGTYVVRRGDSVWSIADDLAGGDPERTVEVADEILDANLGRTMPDGGRFTSPAYIEVGWRLTIPAAVTSSVVPGVHVVRPGDSLSRIAAGHLGEADAWPAIWEANAGTEMGDGRTFDDPDLILPGWSLEIPDPTSDTEADDAADQQPAPDEEAGGQDVRVPDVAAGDDAERPAASEPDTPTDPDGQESASTEPPAGEPAVATLPATPASTASTSAEPTTATGAPVDATPTVSVGGPAGTTPSTTTTTTTPGTDGNPSASSHAAAPRPSPAQPIRIEHAAMLAAGVIALLGVRRRRRLRAALPRTRVPEPRATATAMERRLRLVDAGERAQRVDVAIRAAAAALIDSGVQVGLVVTAADGAVTLRLTADAELPSPWTGHGSAWELPAAIPIEMISEPARLVGTPCIALAQLGVTADGSDVLIDLEACPALVVDGADDDLIDRIVHGLATALSASPYAEVAHLVTVSVDETALLDHRNTHRAGTAEAALRLATSLSGTGRDESSFALRSKCKGGEVWEPVVLFLRPQDGATAPVAAPVFVAGGGVAIVAGVDVDAGGCRLHPADGHWTFEGFGTSLEVHPVGLTDEDAAGLAELLGEPTGHLDSAAEEPSDLEVVTAPTITTHGPHEPPPHEIVVGLMGEVRVTDARGRPGSFERSKTVELIAWLATHRDRSTRTAARTALWELDVRDATFANVVSEARRALARLVAPPEGEEWVARTLNEQLPLHELVVTDARLIEARLDAARLEPPAQAIETLRPAVEMIRDIPFAGTSYLWPDAEGLTSSLVLLAISTAAEMAGHALSVDDIDTVFWATGRGLAVLPGHEELISLRMRAHARAGDLAGVRHEWEAYERVIVADAWSDGEPAPKLLALRRELLS